MDHQIFMSIFLLVLASNCKAMIEETEIKVCIGTNLRMSVPKDRNQHYRNLRNRYTNCTYVDGNLELTWLDNRNLDLSFIRNIREVTGYILISQVDVPNIIMPSLKIIRGRTLFKMNIMEQYFALFVAYTNTDTLELPALLEISNGSVNFLHNYNFLCHIQTIDWNDIMTESGTFSYDNSSIHERECPKCHKSCTAGCWSEGANNCQNFNKLNCSPYCGGKRCFGPNPRECCSRLCSGGCTGPTNNDCLTCRSYNDNGFCKKKCPSVQRRNPMTGLVEPNPNAKYSYGSSCVRDCPHNLLKDNGACVQICASGKITKNGSCVTCNGPCPKRCSVASIIHSGNIDSFRNCSIIEGSLEISDQSFTGFQQIYANFSLGPLYPSMHPDRLEIFSTLREVTGYVNIDAFHSEFTNLSYFRNLEIINGYTLRENDFSSLRIANTNLKSLELRSLKHIYSGRIIINSNENLCFADIIDWHKIGRESLITDNADQDECRNEGLYCSDDCTSAGCWGKRSHQCLEWSKFALLKHSIVIINTTHTETLSLNSV